MAQKKYWLAAPVAALGVLATGFLSAPSSATQPSAAQPQPRSSTVTLITGDKVTVTAQGDIEIHPVRRTGAPTAGFFRHTGPDGVTVIPAEALPLVRSGALDKALFDVTGLIRQKLDDEHTKELPLLIQSSGAARKSAPVGRITRQLPAAKLTAVTAAKSAATYDKLTTPDQAALTGGATKIWLNGRAKPSLDVSVPQVGAPAAWQAGFTGAGVKVAVLDSGYDATHPDLAGVVKDTKDFIPGDPAGMKDETGHGTHVASTIAGRGTASNGRYVGVAKQADLLIGKVCDPDGCPYDAIIAGMQWAATSGARVVNLSLGGGATDGTDPLSAEINRLTAQTGTLFVVAAGNDGPDGRVSSPATADAALAVASVTKQDTLAEDSSVGPRIGDFALKPDLAAPGVDIVAARAAGTLDDRAVDEHYARLSGTSMATPHVTGGAAILAQQHPDWKAAQLKTALMNSAHPVDAGVYGQGAGRLDLARATTQQVTSSPAGLSFDTVRWSSSTPEPRTQQITYRNAESAPLVLDLKLDVRDATGKAAGLFTVSPSTLTVPAGGQASATVTLTPGDATPGTYGGRLVATGDRTVVQTPVGVTKEPESYNLTVSMKDRNGATVKPESGLSVVQSLDDPTGTYYPVRPGEKLRLPAGQYAVFSNVATPVPGRVESSLTSAAEPELALRRDTVLAIDARQGRPVSLQVDAEDARIVSGMTGMLYEHGDVRAGLVRPIRKLEYAVPTKRPNPDFVFYTRPQLERPLVRLAVKAPNAFEVPVDWVPGGPQLVGRRQLGVVDVGHAGPDEIATHPLKGKLALFTLSAGEEDSFRDRLRQLRAAGAVAAFYRVSEAISLSEADASSLPTLYADDATAGRLAALTSATVTIDGNAGSPYRYELAVPYEGGIPRNPAYRPRNSDLATVQASYSAPGTGWTGYRDFTSTSGRWELSESLWSSVVNLPTRRTEYFSPGPIKWTSSLRVAPPAGDGVQQGYQGVVNHSYRRGEKLTEEWNKPVFGPGFAFPLSGPGTHLAVRDGNVVDVLLPLFSDSAGHTGLPEPDDFNFGDHGKTTLSAGSTTIGTSDVPGAGTFEVPAGRTAYRLSTEVTRTHPYWPLGTKISAAWTFHSASTAKPTPLPLLTVGFDPKLDLSGRAPGGRQFTVPVRVDRQPGSTGGEATLRSVEVSYDDGVHWQQASLTTAGAGWQVSLSHPKEGSVSLRASAIDAEGNSVEQTTIRAYRIG
ncbi:S8 family serine peptidase [Kribbella sp. NPDC051770]|uniref:S8 family peptidase n=1 Tax=Kribbella sp. NPDC051770 TaxID=3155413 RepID=UPI003425279B